VKTAWGCAHVPKGGPVTPAQGRLVPRIEERNMGGDDREEPGEYASPACFLHELDPGFAGLTPAPVAKPVRRRKAGTAEAPPGPPAETGAKADRSG
jgi:hypothetical protein